MYDDKIILTDVDGVLLNWLHSFENWMKQHGYSPVEDNTYDLCVRFNAPRDKIDFLLKIFNESAAIGFLYPYKDAVKYVRKLTEEGFIFHAITSMSKNRHACILREQNLKRLFGEYTFERFEFLDTGASKMEILQEYSGSGLPWIEDHMGNAEAGLVCGLNSFIMMQGHNSSYAGKATKVNNWKEIYEALV